MRERGRSPVQSRLIYKRIRDLAEEHKKPVYVFTEDAAAHLGYQDQFWPNPYLSGKSQAYLVGEREEEERRNMRLALRPASHQLKDDSHDS